MTSPSIALTVDGTALTCKGAIAKLETEFSGLPAGSLARVLLGDVPSRIDVRAWADRKGHRVVEDERRGERFELLIAKDGHRLFPGGSPRA
ncbi:MAG TPA: sulfurtransferase TusA family protein [Thermoplasmata archaeon]|nr:sulfurtransferase TusA family protein [Thermoplasmata archaeon]